MIKFDFVGLIRIANQMALSNRSSLRLNLSSTEFENRKTNHIKNIPKQNLRLLNQKPEFIDCKLSLKQQR